MISNKKSMMDNAASNFLEYLSRYLIRFSPTHKKIAFFYSENYQWLFDLIVSSKENQYQAQIIDIFTLDFDLINSYDFVVIFYDAYTIYQNNKLFEYYHNIVPKFKKFLDKILVLRDIGPMFQELYYHHPDFIAHLNESLLKKASKASLLTITNDKGSRLTAPIKNAKWSNLNGFNARFNLNPSEISTFSPAINGELYVTGALLSQIPIGMQFGLINESHIIRIKVSNSKISEISSLDSSLNKELNNYCNYSTGNREIIELGIGTNTGIKSLLGRSSSYEESHPGFHLGIGGSAKNSQHLDFILNDSNIFLDNDIVFSNGAFTLN